MATPPPSFYFQDDGLLFCEQVDIGELVNSLPTLFHQIPIQGKSISTEVATTPFFLYSTSALRNNVDSYMEAMKTCQLNGVLGYAMKANGNPEILKLLKSFGVEMLITVSGYEIVSGLQAGFLPKDIILNGNGKQVWEIKLALEHGVLLNVDSIFDAEQILRLSSKFFPQKNVGVLLRVRPPPFECNVSVHPFVNTSDKSKFGFDTRDMSQILEILQEHEKIKVYGIHCHLGSCIYDPAVYEYIAAFVRDLSLTLTKTEEIYPELQLLDLGGGIGINYHGVVPGIEPFLSMDETKKQNIPESNNPDSITQEMPPLVQFMEPMARLLPKNVKVLLEPGRSLVGNSGVLVTKILGTKQNRNKNYVTVDSAMTDLIRPCLYGSHHRIYSTKLDKNKKWQLYDVVGPVCESADFLGKDILLQNPCSGTLAIMDCGAYAASMSSNYNMRPKIAEIIVDGCTWRTIRKRETYQDTTAQYNVTE